MIPPPPRIRHVGAGDEALLDRVADDVFDGPVDAALLREFLAGAHNRLVVAIEDDGSVVGMATGLCHLHPDKPLHMFINEVGVAPGFRGRGVGRDLVRALLDEAWRIGCTEAWVATESDNDAARALYRTTGGVQAPESIVMYTFKPGGAAPA